MCTMRCMYMYVCVWYSSKCVQRERINQMQKLVDIYNWPVKIMNSVTIMLKCRTNKCLMNLITNEMNWNLPLFVLGLNESQKPKIVSG